MARKDVNRPVRAEAIDLLAKTKDAKYKDLFLQSVKDSSYTVAGAALEALLDMDEAKALSLVTELKKDNKGRLKTAVEKAEIYTKTDADFNDMYTAINKASLYEKFNKMGNFLAYLSKVNDVTNFKKGVDLVVKFRNQIAPYSAEFKGQMNKALLKLKDKREAAKAKGANAADVDAQKAYIDEVTKD